MFKVTTDYKFCYSNRTFYSTTTFHPHVHWQLQIFVVCNVFLSSFTQFLKAPCPLPPLSLPMASSPCKRCVCVLCALIGPLISKLPITPCTNLTLSIAQCACDIHWLGLHCLQVGNVSSLLDRLSPQGPVQSLHPLTFEEIKQVGPSPLLLRHNT